MNEHENLDGMSGTNRTTVYKRIRDALALASQLILAAPVKLPPKVVNAAKCVSLVLGVLEAIDTDPAPQTEGAGHADE